MRMIFTLLTAAVLSLAASFAAALDLDSMSDAERAAFRAQVRAYLLDNPEVLLEAMQVLEDRQLQAEAEADTRLLSQYRDEIFDDGISFVGGNPEGDITVVEFLDYRCGYCKRAHPAIKDLLASDGNIRLIVKEYPILGPDSETASRAAIAVKQLFGDEAYGAFSDTLMEFNGPINDKTIGAIVTRARLDGAAVVAHLNTDAVSEHIAEVRELGLGLGVQGTPTFIFGDQIVRGFIELDAMQQVVAQQRSAAN